MIEMTELDEIKKKKMEEYMAMQSQDIQNIQQAAQIQAELKKAISQILDSKAIERLGNIKLTKPELALQIELYLIQLYQTGQLKAPLKDEEFKDMLDKLIQKRKTNIIRK